MWPAFDSRTRRHMWVEFVVGSRPCSERFFPGYSGFPLSSKTNISKFQFDLDTVEEEPPSGSTANSYLFIYLSIYFLFILFTYSEGFDKKMENPNGRVFTIMEIRGHGGITHFGNSEGRGKLKYGSRPWYGMDIFWNCPLWENICVYMTCSEVCAPPHIFPSIPA